MCPWSAGVEADNLGTGMTMAVNVIAPIYNVRFCSSGCRRTSGFQHGSMTFLVLSVLRSINPGESAAATCVLFNAKATLENEINGATQSPFRSNQILIVIVTLHSRVEKYSLQSAFLSPSGFSGHFIMRDK